MRLFGKFIVPLLLYMPLFQTQTALADSSIFQSEVKFLKDIPINTGFSSGVWRVSFQSQQYLFVRRHNPESTMELMSFFSEEDSSATQAHYDHMKETFRRLRKLGKGQLPLAELGPIVKVRGLKEGQELNIGYLIKEIPGKNLKQLIEERLIDQSELDRIVLEVQRQLDLHQRVHSYHGDLLAENVMVQRIKSSPKDSFVITLIDYSSVDETRGRIGSIVSDRNRLDKSILVLKWKNWPRPPTAKPRSNFCEWSLLNLRKYPRDAP